MIAALSPSLSEPKKTYSYVDPGRRNAFSLMSPHNRHGSIRSAHSTGLAYSQHLRHLRMFRQRFPLQLYPVVQRLHQRDASGFPDRKPFVCRTTAYISFDGVQLRYPLRHFRPSDDVHVRRGFFGVRAPGMRPI